MPVEPENNRAARAKVAAEALGVSDDTLRRWAKAGKIKCIRTAGGQYRYDLRHFLERHQVSATTGGEGTQ